VAAVKLRFCDELDGVFGWLVEDEFEHRCSHALVVDGRVWLTDPLDGEGVEERVRAAGEPAGVIQLLDRHNRDCGALAAKLGVPHHKVPIEPIPGAPFEFLAVRKLPFWKEVALWWPERSLLVCADALGAIPFFAAPGQRLGVHPFLRLTPPRRQLGGLQPEVVLSGHGEGVLSDAAPVFHEALSTSRRRTWSALAGGFRSRGG
jgi:hypothetical protein